MKVAQAPWGMLGLSGDCLHPYPLPKGEGTICGLALERQLLEQRAIQPCLRGKRESFGEPLAGLTAEPLSDSVVGENGHDHPRHRRGIARGTR